MASDIKQRISLEGAEDVIRRLQDMGVQGAASLNKIKDAADKAPLANVSAQLEKIKESAPGFVSGLNGVVGGMTSIGGLFQKVLGFSGPLALAFGALGGTVAGFAKAANDSIVSTSRMAKSLGLSAESFQVLRSAAGKLGIEPEKLAHGLAMFEEQARAAADKQKGIAVEIAKDVSKDLPGKSIKIIDVKSLEEARRGIAQLAPIITSMLKAAGENGIGVPAVRQSLENLALRDPAKRDQFRQLGFKQPAQTTAESLQTTFAPQGDAFAKLGLSALDSEGKVKSLETRLREWVDAVAAIKDPTEQAARIFEVFGRRLGPEMAPLIRQGTAAWDEIREKLRENGIAITDELEKMAEQNERVMKRLEKAWDTLSKKIGIAALPALTKGLEGASTLFDTPKERAAREQQDVKDRGGVTRTDELRARFGEPPQFLKNLTGENGAQVQNGMIAAFREIAQSLLSLNRAGAAAAGSGAPNIVTPPPDTQGTAAAGEQLKASMAGAGEQTKSFGEALAALGELIKKVAASVPPIKTTGGFADGGRVFGAGTATSDSIPAFLSHGEYVVNARATERNLPALHAINSGFALGGVVDVLRNVGARHFDIGGYVGNSLSPYIGQAKLAADKAVAAGLHPVTLDFGGFQVGGLHAQPDAISDLKRASVHAQNVRTGPKPSWYR